MNVKNDRFNPNTLGVPNGNFFGLPCQLKEAEIVIVPVPWDVTVSYGEGTSRGPQAIMQASLQVDLMSPFMVEAWSLKLSTLEFDNSIIEKNDRLRTLAKKIIAFYEEGGVIEEHPEMLKILSQINQDCDQLNYQVEQVCLDLMSKGKKVLLLGGDHSTPLGLIRATAKFAKRPFSILHVDAHADLRVAYEGFDSSHASIMYNCYRLPQIQSLVQVGIRDYCQQELDLIKSESKIRTFFDWDLRRRALEGVTWVDQVDEIISNLADDVYLSIDIDGLDPRYCPHTGTPVPGGLEYDQLLYLLYQIHKSGRRFVGADLVEVAPHPSDKNNEWDANVGARLLFNMAVFLKI